MSTFVGRVGELAEVDRLVRRDRLVSLIGPGGVGKTRLGERAALRLADAFPDGVIWSDLSAVEDPHGVDLAVASALDLRESPPLALVDTISLHLGRQRALLVLDNCERQAAACAALTSELLSRCPSVHVLATSRQRLGIEGEVAYLVPGMAVPPDAEAGADEIARFDAVELFVERATRFRPQLVLTEEDARAVADICRRIDGMPLAIELAAARIRMMTPHQIAARMRDRFGLLTGGSSDEPRQRTLRASVEWSYEPLEPQERVLLRRLAVFAGGFGLEAAERVVSDEPLAETEVLDLLGGLIDKSLVAADDAGTEVRFRLLETIREYALERLEEDPDEATSIRNRHLAEFLRMAEGSDPGSADVFEWLERLDADHANLRAALEWGLRTGRSAEAARFAAVLGPYWKYRGSFAEGRRYLEAALELDELSPDVRVHVLLEAAHLAQRQWDLTAAEELAARALDSVADSGAPAAEARVVLGWTASFTGRAGAADEHFAAAVAMAEAGGGTSGALARALCGAAQTPFASGEWHLAGPLFERSLQEARAGAEIDVILDDLFYLFQVHWMSGRDEQAEAVAAEGLELAARLRDPTLRSEFLSFLACRRIRRGELAAASELLDQALATAERSGSPFPLAYWQSFQALAARTRGDLDDAAVMCEALADAATALGALVPATMFSAYAAEVACLRGDLDHAAAMAERSVESRLRAGGRLPLAPWAQAVVAYESGAFEHAEELAHASMSDALALGFNPQVIQALELLGSAVVRAGRPAEGVRLLAASTSALDEAQWVRPATMVPRYEAALSAARAALGEEAFDAEFQAGRNLTLDEVVAYARRGRGPRNRPSSGWESLTPAELEVARLAAEGLTNPRIAERLFVSRSTVKTHLSHIFSKLGIETRAELAAIVTRRIP